MARKLVLVGMVRSFLHGRISITASTVAILLCCGLFSASAKASCQRPPNARAAMALPETHSYQTLGLQEQDDSASIVGLWHIHFLSGGQVFDEGFDLFHSDGKETLNDNAQPQPAYGAGTVCLGVYKKTGTQTYKLRHPFWIFDANGILAGTGVFLEQIVVAKDGKTFSGSFSFFTYALSGAVTSEATGELTADRITVD